MNRSITPKNLGFTIPIALLLALAAGAGILVKGLYRDGPGLVAQANGQDAVSLGIVLPGLIISAIRARRGSMRAGLFWLGSLVYLVYTYASFAFAIHYNPLFLAYIALLGCSLYALIGGITGLDLAGIKARFSERAPIKAISIFLAVLAVLFYLLWLSELVPALIAGEVPQSIIDTGTPTNVIHVLDLAWILPAFLIAAANLWRKRPLGYILAGIMLPFFTLLVSATLAMALAELDAGNADAAGMAGLFGTLLLAGTGILAWYWKSMPRQARLDKEATPLKEIRIKERTS